MIKRSEFKKLETFLKSDIGTGSVTIEQQVAGLVQESTQSSISVLTRANISSLSSFKGKQFDELK